jgi:hypothetical protein
MVNVIHKGRTVITLNNIETAYVWIATMNQMQRFMDTEIRKYCVIAS